MADITSTGPDPGQTPPPQAEAVKAVKAAETAETAEPADAGKRSAARSVGLRAAVAGALVTALVSSIVNPDFLGRAWNAVTGGDDPPAAPPPAVALESKPNERLSIIAKAPVTWGVARTRFNVFGSVTPGDTLSTGTDPFGRQSGGVARLFVGASRDGVKRLGVKPADPDAALVARLHRDDWTVDGCRLVGETPYPHDTLAGPMREWTGCNSFADSVMWEAWTLTPDSGALVYVQLVIRRNDLEHATGLEMLRSIVVDPARLSG